MPNAEDPERERRAAIGRMAKTVGLDIAAAHCDGVAANFTRIETLAALVMNFPLSDQPEIGVIFVP